MRSTRSTIYLLGFFFTLHFVIPVYINSSFLSSLIGSSRVGLLYGLGSLLTIGGLLAVARALEKFGNFSVSIILYLLEALVLSLLAFTTSSAIVLPAFALHFALSSIILFNIDVFLEHYSKNITTGGIRGIFLTLTNFAWMLAPIIGGFAAEGEAFQRVYFIALLLLIPSFLILLFRFNKFRDVHYKRITFVTTIRRLWANSDIRNIFIANFWLKVFFSWMVIYIPIYLHETIGLSFAALGIIFTVMLLGYVLVEYPLGRIADTILGEREILVTGFGVIAVFTVLLTFISSSSAVVWALLLFGTRVGAAMIEIMSETYFFKKISDGDSDILSIFRTTTPLGFLIGPLFASTFLAFFSLQYLFVAAGVFMLVGAYFAGLIKDTR